MCSETLFQTEQRRGVGGGHSVVEVPNLSCGDRRWCEVTAHPPSWGLGTLFLDILEAGSQHVAQASYPVSLLPLCRGEEEA